MKLKFEYDILNSKNYFAILLLLLVGQVVLWWPNAANLSPRNDEMAYLWEANFIHRESPGIELISSLFLGKYRHDNRMPMLPWMISSIFEGQWEDHVRAKHICWLLALLVGPGLFLIMRFSGVRIGVALIASIMVITSPLFSTSAGRISSEPLLTLLLGGALICFARLKTGNSRLYLFASGLMGLSYWVKGSTLVMMPLVLIGAYLVWPGHWKRGSVLLVKGLFVVTILMSPLLANNTIRHGNPLHNWNSMVMWLDGYEESMSPEFIRGETGTFSHYARTHTMHDVVERFWDGAIKYIYRLTEVTRPFNRWLLVSLTCMFLLGARRTELRELIIILATFAVYFVSLAWFAPLTSSSRFYIQLLPAAFMICSRCLPERGLSKEKIFRYINPILIFTVCIFGYLSWVGPIKVLRKRCPKQLALNTWIESAEGRARFLFGPCNYLNSIFFSSNQKLAGVIPHIRNVSELIRHLHDMDARYVVLTDDVRKIREGFAGFVDFHPGGGLMITEIPDQLRLAHADPVRPCRYLVFELND